MIEDIRTSEIRARRSEAKRGTSGGTNSQTLGKRSAEQGGEHVTRAPLCRLVTYYLSMEKDHGM